MAGKFDIYNERSLLVVAGVEEQEAARLLNVDPYEFTWCIQEHGRCDTANLMAVPAGPPS